MKARKKKHSWEVRRRAFAIWQELGYFPWHKAEENKRKRRRGDFYRGAFDNIPFLNDDAKRTFVHLLLRPGYMIRDYINGKHSSYLAPLTALIIFYAFFGLVSSLMRPYEQKPNIPFQIEEVLDENKEQNKLDKFVEQTVLVLRKGFVLMHLDQFPEEVDTQAESSLAALESTLRSQGIPLFIGQFLVLWMAIAAATRKRKMSLSACAAISAYILCQFSFFMLFAVLFSFGKSASIGPLLMLVLLSIDYRQLLGLEWRKTFSLAFRTFVLYCVFYGMMYLSGGVIAAIIAWIRL